MSISSETRRAGPFAGNGTTVNFPFTFKVFTTAQVVVTRTVSGVETVLTLTTDYTVSLNSNQDTSPGGTVTMLVAPATGQSLTITSNVANLQPTVLANLGGFYPEVLNDSLDRATIQIQQLDERVDRALTLPVSSSGIDTELPVPTSGALIGWNPGATALQNYNSVPIGGTIYQYLHRTIAAAGQTAFVLPVPYTLGANALSVFVNGLRVEAGSGLDYVETNTTTITFTSGLTNGDLVVVGIQTDVDAAATPPNYTIDGIAALRLLNSSTTANHLILLRNYVMGDGGGIFRYDSTDNSSADNGGTIIVDAANRRWLRQYSGAVNVRWFGAVGDGVADDTAALQAALSASNFESVYVPSGNYLSGPLYHPHGKFIDGENVNNTAILFDSTTSKDGLVLGWRNTVAYVNEAAFLAAIAGLQDGWYLIGSTDLRFVLSGAQAGSSTRVIAPVTSSNAGYRVSNIRLSGVSITKIRDLLVCDNLWKVDLDHVWAYTAGGRGFVLNQCLHASTRGLRSDDTVGHGADLTGGDTTSTTMEGGYHRGTHSGAGIKSDCIGLTLIGPICESVGGGSGTDVYAPGIWISGGVATIVQPYFEDVRGHNIFCSAGLISIVGGSNNPGEGSLNTRYAALVVTGTAKATVNGAAYASGGGNKQDIFVSRDAGLNDVWLTGSGPANISVLADDIADPLNYTEADYDVADSAALAALTGMTSGQTAHVRSDTSGLVRNYEYDGAAWVKVSSHNFNGAYTGRDPTTGFWRTFGENLAIRAGNSLSAIIFMRSVTFDAGASFDNIATLQNGATVNAHTAATTTKALGFTIPGYSGAQAKSFQARFNTPLLSAGIVCQVNILGATSVQIVILNTTAASINLNADIRGQIVIERWTEDSD